MYGVPKEVELYSVRGGRYREVVYGVPKEVEGVWYGCGVWKV